MPYIDVPICKPSVKNTFKASIKKKVQKCRGKETDAEAMRQQLYLLL